MIYLLAHGDHVFSQRNVRVSGSYIEGTLDNLLGMVFGFTALQRYGRDLPLELICHEDEETEMFSTERFCDEIATPKDWIIVLDTSERRGEEHFSVENISPSSLAPELEEFLCVLSRKYPVNYLIRSDWYPEGEDEMWVVRKNLSLRGFSFCLPVQRTEDRSFIKRDHPVVHSNKARYFSQSFEVSLLFLGHLLLEFCLG